MEELNGDYVLIGTVSTYGCVDERTVEISTELEVA